MVCGGVEEREREGERVKLISLRRLSHVTGLAFLRLLSCDNLKDLLLWIAALPSVGVASLIHSQVNKQTNTHKHKNNAPKPLDTLLPN